MRDFKINAPVKDDTVTFQLHRDNKIAEFVCSSAEFCQQDSLCSFLFLDFWVTFM